jgi:hypothetical protein
MRLVSFRNQLERASPVRRHGRRGVIIPLRDSQMRARTNKRIGATNEIDSGRKSHQNVKNNMTTQKQARKIR